MEQKMELLSVLKELHNISGFRISVHGTDFSEIVSYPPDLTEFCRLVQEDKNVRRSCEAEDENAFDIVKRTGEVYVYQCNFGLFEAVAPIYDFGVLTGYLMMGQILDTATNSTAYVMQKACFHISDQEALLKAVQAIPLSSKDKILSCIAIMNICAEYITLSDRLNLTERTLAHAVKKYISQNYASKISIDLLCEHFFCSRSTLINHFKRVYHKTVNQYLNEVRLEHAASLLLHSNRPIYEISEQCGFSSQNYFSKLFLKNYRLTPSQYRFQSEELE
ncbi:MAG: PocR ligand-binding domain-containing protein [Clostridiales bacterium]|nr:PocR ligand-binding domain-containing protein [Clostridiales bacterium]